jgi:aryl-alcohol dehydrogenase-like predicted oxidoreductase
VASLQNAYSLLCRNFDSGLAECCAGESVSLLAYSPLAMGLLTGKYLEPGGGPKEARWVLLRAAPAHSAGAHVLLSWLVGTGRVADGMPVSDSSRNVDWGGLAATSTAPLLL